MPRHTLLIFISLILILAAPTQLPAQSPHATDDATSPPAGMVQPFKAAYLRVGLEVTLPAATMDALPDFLMNQPALREALAQSGHRSIVIYQIDSFQEMLDRLNHQEFDLAYCPAKILVEQSAGYIPILQLRPPRMIADSSQGRITAWRGVIIGSRTSPIFAPGAPPLADNELAAYFRDSHMAFPSAHSAVGYIYPLLSLRRRFDVHQPGGFAFLGSSQEVARAVINGIIPVGACEEGALMEVVASIPPRNGQPWQVDQVVQILARTPPAQTDPIIVRGGLAPEQSTLGLALRDALRRYHDQTPSLPRVGESVNEDYNQMREDLQLFRLGDEIELDISIR